ncbi:MAG: endonuclease/exonuclease/phosphatase family protein [Caldilineaceae bacterium]
MYNQRLLVIISYCLAIGLRITSEQVVPLFVFAQSRQAAVPIYQIQGKTSVSPYYKAWIDTYGVVTGVLQDGFYLQDPVGDSDPTTSDGIFVYTRSVPTVQRGQCISITRAYVDEFYEKTELSRFKSLLQDNRCSTTSLTPIAIPLARMGSVPTTLFEAYEGMLVELHDLAGLVQGPTKLFANGDAEVALLPERLRPYLPGGRVFQADPPAMNALIYLTNELGVQLPNLAWGATVQVGTPTAAGTITRAILDYNFGKYQLHLLPETPIASQPATRTPERGSAATPDDFTICNFNLLGLGRGSAQYPDAHSYDQQLAKRAQTIAESLQGCTIIGLQETGTPADAETLAAFLRTTYNLNYQATVLAGPGTQSSEFPLTNGLLTRTDRVEVRQAALAQACSRQNYAVPVVPGDCPLGAYALFDRPPLVVDLLVRGDWQSAFPLTVIVNHWKSKAGDEKVNAVRRLAQARHVATLVQQQIDHDRDAQVVVLGDLNDYYESPPIETLKTAVTPPLHHLYDYLLPSDRYTYIFNGGSQVLDHVLVTPNLTPLVAAVDVVHINADYPSSDQAQLQAVQRSSDHDPVQVRLRPTGAAILAGALRYPQIQVQLRSVNARLAGAPIANDPITRGTIVAETSTDANGDFRFWNLSPGAYTLTLVAPAAVTIDKESVSLQLTTGYEPFSEVTVTHRTVKFGVALVRTAATLTAEIEK